MVMPSAVTTGVRRPSRPAAPRGARPSHPRARGPARGRPRRCGAHPADRQRGWRRCARPRRRRRPAEHTSSRKTIEHPEVGAITLDCDVLSVPGADLRIVAHTAAAGSTDENKLDLLRVTAAT
ncbi:hypothetical protein [Amycolatopsis sacchari]|uniref:MmyB family transcriptional regulator n=2 Tax=Pseudonocardiaceae TaxID=2070 RepID=UPI003182FFC5